LYVVLHGVILVEEQALGGPGRSRASGALEHVANRPIAGHVLDALVQAGAEEEIIIAASAQATSEIREELARDRPRGPRVRYVELSGTVDVVGALRQAAPFVGDAPCIVHLGNGLLGEPLPAFSGCMPHDSPDVVVMIHQGESPEEHLAAATQNMLGIAELDRERTALGMAGVWMFGPGALQQVLPVSWHRGGDIDLTEVADRVGAAGGSLQFRLVSGWRAYAGNPLDLLEINEFALDRLDVEHSRSQSNGTRIEGRVQIHERARVRGSVIVGPTVIGPGAIVSDAYIGPYTSIGTNVCIEGAEIERSIISAGASITHIGGRLVSSVVGRDAKIFRDFSLPRALRLRVGDCTEVALC
jgi:glucose-1-phosphate thymidylyltransferase